MISKKYIPFLFIVGISKFSAQEIKKDSVQSNWTTHFQATVIGQQHSGFKAKYSGENSLKNNVEPAATSLTATLFLGRKLWKGATFYVNPEVSGGKGLSFATGVAGALNGETYRVGAAEPQVFIARAYLQQHIPLSGTDYEYLEDGANQIAEKVPSNRITISIGKFAAADFYDHNSYAKDPRSQFMNWSVWANGAWDYPANTRGYTFGAVVELIKPTWEVRLSTVAVPKIANFHSLEYNGKAHSETLELEYKPKIHDKPGSVKLIISNTYSKAPSYADGIKALQNGNDFLLDVIRGKAENNVYSGKKLMVGLCAEQKISEDVGVFGRFGWNDGKYASWAFTEIDQTFQGGASIKGSSWKRDSDVVGIAFVSNGISQKHREFLRLGGYGFIIGDGTLSYGRENIIETYYNAKLTNFWWLTLDYQLIINPGYNSDRGPVHVFGLRSHFEF